MDIQFFQHHLLKKLSFFPLSGLSCRSFHHTDKGLLLGYLFYWSVCLSLGQYHTVFINTTLQYVLKSENIKPPILLFFKTGLAILGPLRFHKNFRVDFLY